MIGQTLRNARFRSHKRLGEMARICHVAKSSLSNYETGRRKVPVDIVLAYWRATYDDEIRQAAIAEQVAQVTEFVSLFADPYPPSAA